MICKYCGSSDLQKRGTRKSGKQVYWCKTCGRWPLGEIKDSTQCNQSPAKILLFDIEILPMQVYVWQLGGNDWINPDNIIQDWAVLSWAAKWLYDDNMKWGCLTSFEARNYKDKRIVESMWSLLDEADIVIGHNSIRYDHKKLNARFLFHHMKPPMYYRMIDTKKVLKENFSISSNKLDYANQYLGIHQKTETDFELWKNCVKGNQKAIDTMLQYNINDVSILEELYTELLPWIPNHPSMRMYVSTDGDVCSNCGSSSLNWKGWYKTNLSKYRAFRCNNCGAIGRSTKRTK